MGQKIQMEEGWAGKGRAGRKEAQHEGGVSEAGRKLRESSRSSAQVRARMALGKYIQCFGLLCGYPKHLIMKCCILLRMLNSALPWMCSLLSLYKAVCECANFSPIFRPLDKMWRVLKLVLSTPVVPLLKPGNCFGEAPLQDFSCIKDASVKPLISCV